MKIHLRAKFSLLIVSLILVLVVVLSGSLLLQIRKSASDIRSAHEQAVSQIESQGIKLAGTLANALINHVYFFQMDTIRDLTASARRQHGVLYLYVHDPSGQIIHDGTDTIEAYNLSLDDERTRELRESQTIQTWFTGVADPADPMSAVGGNQQEQRIFHVTAPISIGSDLIGGIRIGFDLDSFAAEIGEAQASLSEISDSGLENLLFTLLAVTVFFVALGVILADQLARWLARPIEAIAQVTKQIGRGDYNVAIPVRRSDEIGDLAANVERMAHNLAESEKSLLAQHREIQEHQQELIQLKKLESLGSFTAGIAHNLNNFMQPIGMLSEVLLKETPKGTREREILERILASNRRAAELLRNLVTYARQEVTDKIPQPIYDVVDETLSLVLPTLPSTIRIRRELDPNVGLATINKGQIQTVLLNLISNAVDSLHSKVGDISVTLSRHEPGTRPGSRARAFARLTVGDTGVGMNRETVERMFDPFFTTKAVGSGTGLGLSTAFGIIEEHAGSIRCESEPDKGTTIEILLPLAGNDSID